jgi:hypothetical protein
MDWIHLTQDRSKWLLIKKTDCKLAFHILGSRREESYMSAKKKSRRIYKHTKTEHESKHAACSMNFNFDDMGISLGTCSCNMLRGLRATYARARREASAPIRFLYLKALDPVKIISFCIYFTYLLLQGASRGVAVSGSALQGSGFDFRWCHLNFSLT